MIVVKKIKLHNAVKLLEPQADAIIAQILSLENYLEDKMEIKFAFIGKSIDIGIENKMNEAINGSTKR